MGQCMGRKTPPTHQRNSQKYLTHAYHQQFKSKSQVFIPRRPRDAQERHPKDDKLILQDQFVPMTNTSVVSGNESMQIGRGMGENQVGMKGIKEQQSVDVRIENLLRRSSRIREVYGRVSKKFSG